MIDDNDEIGLIIEILYSLKDNIRRRITEVIFLAGDGGISFKTIVSRSGIPPTTAAYHLKIMVRIGIVEKSFFNIEGRRDYSFYQLTQIGTEAILMINDIYNKIVRPQDHDRGEMLPEIQIIPMRIGPRCVGIDLIEG
jgi:DNA-binding MarR family transcriptional regulator